MYPADFPIISGQTYFLVAVRLMAALAVAPVLGSQLMPVPVRVSLGLLFAVVITPVVPVVREAATIAEYVVAVLRESLLGFLAGFGLRLVFQILHLAAGLIGVQMGLSMVAGIDAIAAEQETTLERFFVALATLIFLQVDGLHLFLLGLQGLFVAFPIGGTGLPALGADSLMLLMSSTFVAGVRIAMPVMGALLLADAGLALAARAVPQLNLFAVGIPEKILLGLFSLSLALPPVTVQVAGLFRRLPIDLGLLFR